jgi:hypothetical protein
MPGWAPITDAPVWISERGGTGGRDGFCSETLSLPVKGTLRSTGPLFFFVNDENPPKIDSRLIHRIMSRQNPSHYTEIRDEGEGDERDDSRLTLFIMRR